MIRMLSILSVVTLAACASSQGSQQQKAAVMPRKRMPAPEHLSPEIREHFRREMTAHGDDMTVLLWSILFLDVDGAADFAQEIKQMNWLKRPAEGEESQVPERIYALQEELVSRAEKLSAVASAGDHEPEELANVFGEVAQTCVKCHSYYLYQTGPRRSAEEEGSVSSEP